LNSLFLLIPMSLLILVGVIVVFIWAVNTRQFDDLEKHGYDIIFDTDENLALNKKKAQVHDAAKPNKPNKANKASTAEQQSNQYHE
jgi:cbb3-type cytochrome oxidase maturation protein